MISAGANSGIVVSTVLETREYLPAMVEGRNGGDVEQRRVYSIYYYGTLTLPYKRGGERAVEAVAVRVDSGREQEMLLFYTRYRLLYILSYKRDSHSCIA